MKATSVLIVATNLIVLISAQQFKPECFPPPNTKNPRECCEVPNVMPSREIFTSCMQKFPMPMTPPTPGTPPPGANCIAQCILEQLGMMTNGAISKDAAKSKVSSLVGSSAEWQTVAQGAVESCFTKASAVGSQKDSSGCNVIAGEFFECLPTAMFKSCPKSFWTANPECEQQKAHLEKGCPIMSLMKGPPQL